VLESSCGTCCDVQKVAASIKRSQQYCTFIIHRKKSYMERKKFWMVVSRKCCACELLEHVTGGFPDLQQRMHVQQIQERLFEVDKKTAWVVQIDFAMAYQCEYQDETQSRESITLFTAAMFTGRCYAEHCIVGSIRQLIDALGLLDVPANAQIVWAPPMLSTPCSTVTSRSIHETLVLQDCRPIEWTDIDWPTLH